MEKNIQTWKSIVYIVEQKLLTIHISIINIVIIIISIVNGVGILQIALGIGIIFVIVFFILNSINNYKQWQKEEIIKYNNNVMNYNIEIRRIKSAYPILKNSITELKTVPVNLVETENIFNLNYKLSIYEKENITIDNQNMEIINKYNLVINSFNQIFK